MRTVIIFVLLFIVSLSTAIKCKGSYCIKSGDICYNIAKANSMSVKRLQFMNPSMNCNSLQIGQSITGVGIAPGTTIATIPTATTFTINIPTTAAVTAVNTAKEALVYVQDGQSSVSSIGSGRCARSPAST